MTRTLNSRMDGLEQKMDELIRLSHKRDAQLSDIAKEVAEMRPTVQQVADALTFAKVGKSVLRVSIGIGAISMPIVLWVTGKWNIIVQLFRASP